jgi:hypothetical protein
MVLNTHLLPSVNWFTRFIIEHILELKGEFVESDWYVICVGSTYNCLSAYSIIITKFNYEVGPGQIL